MILFTLILLEFTFDVTLKLLAFPVKFAAFKLLKLCPLPENTPVFAINVGAITFPLTPKLINVPTLVMLGCALLLTVCATLETPPFPPVEFIVTIPTPFPADEVIVILLPAII